MNLVDSVQQSLSSYLDTEVSVNWVEDNVKSGGYESEGYYRIEYDNGRHFEVYSDEVLKSLLPPRNDRTESILDAIKRSKRVRCSDKKVEVEGLSLRRAILSPRYLRGYIMNKVKKPLQNKIIKLVDKFPEPTIDNVEHPNSKILLAIRDDFFKHERLSKRVDLLKAVFKILIVEYEHDIYYRQRMNWCLNELKKYDWKEYENQFPEKYWEE